MSAESTTRTPVIQAKGLVKTFGRVVGLDGVDLELYPGEVLAIIGDNGAGKSTLVKCLSGAYTPDSGELLLDGEPMLFHRPQDARAAGIETVYQSLAVSPALDIASNLYLGREERRQGVLGSVFRMLDHKGMRARSKQQVLSLGITTLQSMTQSVETLSGGQRQAVAVARAAAFGSKVVILDEPTAALGVKQTAQVISLVRSIAARGTGVILVTHDLSTVRALADRIVVLSLGHIVYDGAAKHLAADELWGLMAGGAPVGAQA